MSYFKDPFTLKDAFTKAAGKVELSSRFTAPHKGNANTKRKKTITTDKQNRPAFYLFAEGENGDRKRVGTAFRHKKGNGLNILIGDTRYVAFPPKEKSETGGV